MTQKAVQLKKLELDSKEGEDLTFTPKTNVRMSKISIKKDDINTFYNDQVFFKSAV